MAHKDWRGSKPARLGQYGYAGSLRVGDLVSVIPYSFEVITGVFVLVKDSGYNTICCDLRDTSARVETLCSESYLKILAR